MTDGKMYTDMRESFSDYLTENKLRKTEERYMIFDEICAFDGHFDIYMLHRKLSDAKYHVSKATLYNTLKVLIDAGLVVRHQIDSKSVQYELKKKAATHLHLVCTKCNSIRDIKSPASLTANVKALNKRLTVIDETDFVAVTGIAGTSERAFAKAVNAGNYGLKVKPESGIQCADSGRWEICSWR